MKTSQPSLDDPCERAIGVLIVDDHPVAREGLRVLRLEMVDKSTTPCKPTSGRFSVLKQSREAFSSRSEAPFELFCGYLHPSPHDMIQHPI
jgi:hypothetical protein